MRTTFTRRKLAAALMAPAFILATPALAAANDGPGGGEAQGFESTSTNTGRDGASSRHVQSCVDEDGNVWNERTKRTANENGVGRTSTGSGDSSACDSSDGESFAGNSDNEGNNSNDEGSVNANGDANNNSGDDIANGAGDNDVAGGGESQGFESTQTNVGRNGSSSRHVQSCVDEDGKVWNERTKRTANENGTGRTSTGSGDASACDSNDQSGSNDLSESGNQSDGNQSDGNESESANGGLGDLLGLGGGDGLMTVSVGSISMMNSGGGGGK